MSNITKALKSDLKKIEDKRNKMIVDNYIKTKDFELENKIIRK